MEWLETKVILENEAAINAADVIADIFSDIGVSGTVLEDPTLTPDEGWGEDAVPLPDQFSVIGYLPVNPGMEEKCRILEQRLAMLAKKEEISFRILTRKMDEQDWAESWKEHFWPERLSDRIVIKPTWRAFDAGPDDIILEIDPGMAFGTGTHPTTASCICMMERYVVPGCSMLDIGTGSGILMVAAAKLGARSTCGVDNDDVAVEIAEKNLLLNGILPETFTLFAGDLVDCVKARFDVVCANILSEVIIRLLDGIAPVMAENGVLVTSGIIEKNAPKVVEKMNSIGFAVKETVVRDGWVTLAAGQSEKG